MLRDPPAGLSKQNVEDEGFVPELSLNEFVIKQMEKIKECDTITGDPHKSGFCPYPAGAICYRKKELNNFVNFTSETVYYHGKNNLGDLGIEGSKPGSAASAVHMANKVIGLHKDGYGRLLAECMFTAKVLYCYLVCMAEDDDDFVVEMTKPLPADVTKDYIRNNIIGKTNEELANDDELMKILRRVGPDTLIPCFAVNIRGNKDVQIANEVNQAVFNDLSHISAEETSKRIPLIVTLSTMFHSPTKDPDYLQIVRLVEAPSGLGESQEKDMILKQGVNAELLDVPGSPQFGPDGKIVDPLQNPTSQYEINFIGIDGKEVKVPVVIKQKIWFDGEVLNKSVVS